ncbi:glycoside hydrolase family 16 protein [Pedobacter caeni]|uniref:Glycosyl hydrolases family 16 n=1 Tax=Pedobacter caeni TaxID=288992 RepID=A0A1M5B1Y0_9SPHI|nr:glycoside hydrolase family 16 protein [Pedobacter caeni]SHF36488.1 hypothetical protein SAMN04488522_102985 [Pedobacter caeni]
MKKIFSMAILAIVLFSCKKDSTAENADHLKSERVNSKSAVIPVPGATIINFSGYSWQVKNITDLSVGGPGPNYWANSSVWVDAQGRLHLRIKRDAATGRWNCAEVSSLQEFGYGSYVWKVEGEVDKLDKNVILGLFNYKSGDDGHHEVDIEFARWGNAAWPNFNYTVYPAYGDPATRVFNTYELALNGTYSTYKFSRNSQKVTYKAYHGHNELEANAFYPWSTPDSGFPVSTEALPVHMNLWLFQGLAPSNGQEIEIIIHSFQFTPA